MNPSPICRAFKLPVSGNILAQLFKLSQDADGNIDYKEFINALNWRDNQNNELELGWCHFVGSEAPCTFEDP